MERLSERHTAKDDTVTLDANLLDRAAARLLGLIDHQHGGTKGAPKFPQASLLTFLWRAGTRLPDPAYREAVLTTLRNICQGGIYDHLGGGFARYSVDDRWLVPHFEKMLYDNAQLIELLSLAFIATGDPLFRDRVVETVAWLDREMTTESGAFAASIDADSEGHEGKFYVWSEADILRLLGPEEGAFFISHYGVYPQGNWEGVNILNRLGAMDRLADAEETRLATARLTLLAEREHRTRPATDDKLLADWNGLAIAALALAGTTFARPDWIAMATRAFAFITGPMARDGRLAHSWRDGKSVFPGLATDYANIINAALALHAATLDTAYVREAERLADLVRRHHWDDDTAGYFLPADDAEALIVRPRSETDEATPAANSVMARNLIRLWHLTGKDSYRADADAIIAASAPIRGAKPLRRRRHALRPRLPPPRRRRRHHSPAGHNARPARRDRPRPLDTRHHPVRSRRLRRPAANPPGRRQDRDRRHHHRLCLPGRNLLAAGHRPRRARRPALTPNTPSKKNMVYVS